MPPIRKHHQVSFNNHRVFDPWNSSSTGHQRGETSTGTAWRRTREEKLALQFGSSTSSSPSASCKADSGGGDGEWVWMNDHPSLGSGNGDGTGKETGQRDIRDMFSIGKGSISSSLSGGDSKKETCLSSSDITTSTNPINTQDQPKDSQNIHPQIQEPTKEDQNGSPKKIFANLTIHLNATSSPLISDHALRHLLVAHGATLSLAVSRRVTHIIVGEPNSSTSSSSTTRRSKDKSISGAGGGLSASKLQKEIAKAGCRGFRVVGVEWVLESIKAGKRLSEARFAMNIAGRRQRSVLAFV